MEKCQTEYERICRELGVDLVGKYFRITTEV